MVMSLFVLVIAGPEERTEMNIRDQKCMLVSEWGGRWHNGGLEGMGEDAVGK